MRGSPSHIHIDGARQHNLKNISCSIPKDKLVVITGPSGSGKSSLAFDTLFAEGRRRYINSLSSYARQFLKQMAKPDVDKIEGLSPSIAIEQRRSSASSRSTVATSTEILDYLRILYATCGKPHHPTTGAPLTRFTTQQIIDQILAEPLDKKLIILSPITYKQKGDFKDTLEQLKKEGFLRLRIDGSVYPLDEIPPLNPKKKHSIDIVIDRLKLTTSLRSRLSDSIELALQKGNGVLSILWLNQDNTPAEEWKRSTLNFDPETHYTFPEFTPRHFSFNHPLGACPHCQGNGSEWIAHETLIIPDQSIPLNGEPIAPWKTATPKLRKLYHQQILKLASLHNIRPTTSWEKLPSTFQKLILHGDPEENWEGVITQTQNLYDQSSSEITQKRLQEFLTQQPCRKCQGSRLNPDALAVTLTASSHQPLNLYQLCDLQISDTLRFLRSLTLSPTQQKITSDLLSEITSRLTFLEQVGLPYLSLNRKTSTLSGGEYQRIRLACQLGSYLTGVLYVLDEPSIGLHQRDNHRLIETLKKLRDLGNSIIVVEHDDETMLAADYLLDLGPGSGKHGGELTAQGTPSEIKKCPTSLTGAYLSGKQKIPTPKKRTPAKNGVIKISKASEHNLKNIDASFPIGCLTCVTGVSGSGKSTLVHDILAQNLLKELHQKPLSAGTCQALTGSHLLEKLILIDQSPIGKSPRSNALTYTGAYQPIRDLFANLPASRIRGYTKSRFSLNTPGGRCEHCKGDGQLKIQMNVLPDAYVTCDACEGKRFNRETLEITYKNNSIADILDMTVEQAITLFDAIPAIKEKLHTLSEVGLNYLTLGQSANTLSGGESQRIKLAAELSKKSTPKTCYILDEPTTGLHISDIQPLITLLLKLRDLGSTIIIIEHHLDIIKCADYIIDLGPEGGEAGGEVIIAGTPEEVIKCKSSYTGKYLKRYLKSS